MNKSTGLVSILALLMLAVLSTLAVSIASVTNASLTKADNLSKGQSAQLAAESGLAFMLNRLQSVTVPNNTSSETLMPNLQATLSEKFDNTANLGTAVVTLTNNEVIVPSVQYAESSFQCRFMQLDANTCRLTVTGTANGSSRNVSIDLAMDPATGQVWNRGIATRGRIDMWGQASIVSADPNHPENASLFSAADGEGAVTLQGGVSIAGDVYLSGAGATLDIQGGATGDPSVGGQGDPNIIQSDHLHATDPPILPEVDTTQFASLATGGTITASGALIGTTFNNITIPPGTNPEFGNDCVINGIVYVQAPNKVTFKSDCVVNGFVVTEDGSNSVGDCQIIFKAGVTCNSVETLPDGQGFDEVKQYTGAAVLAPGFDVHFYGHANVTGGAIAADKVDIWGGAQMNITGVILGLSDDALTLHGTNTITIDSQNADPTPTGFVLPKMLTANPDSYNEPIAGGY